MKDTFQTTSEIQFHRYILDCGSMLDGSHFGVDLECRLCSEFTAM